MPVSVCHLNAHLLLLPTSDPITRNGTHVNGMHFINEDNGSSVVDVLWDDRAPFALL